VAVQFEKNQVLVTFDDAKTNTDALVKANRCGLSVATREGLKVSDLWDTCNNAG
jgi:hypothetical protein